MELYLVGGAVRDMLLGRTPSELDFAFTGSMQNFLARHPDLRSREPALPLGRKRGKGIRLSPFHDGTDGFFIACAG